MKNHNTAARTGTLGLWISWFMVLCLFALMIIEKLAIN
jgi:hypothetical protein